MRQEGMPAEEIARLVHAERRSLATQFKQQTPEPPRSLIHHRTLAVYGDPIGPTIEQLLTRGKSWDDIIDSATRPGRLPSFTAGEPLPLLRQQPEVEAQLRRRR